jgi:hypothetical protein
MVSSTSSDIEIEIVKQFRIYLNLQEMCYEMIRNRVKNKDFDCLRLPQSMIRNLKSF